MSIGRKVRFGFYIALFALFIEAVISFHGADELTATSGLVTHTVEALRQLEGLDATLLETESAARGYGLTGERSFQEAIKTDPVLISQKVRSLRSMLADNASQQRRLDALEALMAQRLEPLRKVSELKPASDEERRKEVLALVEQDKTQMGEARRLLAEMSGEERKLLKERQGQAQMVVQSGSGSAALGMMLACVLVLISSGVISRSITKPLLKLRDGALRLGGGDYSHRVTVKTKDEVGEVALVFNQMAAQIEERQQFLAGQTWLKTTLSRFSTVLQGERDLTQLSRTVIEEMAVQLAVRHGVFYLRETVDGLTRLKLTAAYACEKPKTVVEAGEGLAGQCLASRKQIVLEEIPPDYLKVTSALGGSAPGAVLILPLVFEGEVLAVMELARLQSFTPLHLALVEQLAPMLATTLHTIEAALRTEQLLGESKAFAASLGLHQNELKRKNQELLEQSAKLKKSEELLQAQHEELRQANEELEQTNEELQQAGEETMEKAGLLAGQKKELEETNREVELARAALEEKAEQLVLTSQYKSEFLANMSHELRTPLNSLLILSKILAENGGGNLTPKQTQYAETIHSSANSLLDLINDVLDLSKVESGTVELELQDCSLRDLAGFAEATFRHVAEGKGLDFRMLVSNELPAAITTDQRRLQQILANLLSNAFKFTSKGSVTLKIDPAPADWSSPALRQTKGGISLAVIDTGIGIPEEKQAMVFEAFQQAEAGTARKYGGTGLGLSISRELTRLLGGELSLESKAGEGSTFTLLLPLKLDARSARVLKTSRAPAEFGGRPAAEAAATPPAAHDFGRTDDAAMRDDRESIETGELVLLVIEDDPNFARVLMEFAREKKFKVVVTGTAAGGMALARQLKPSAITLDLKLPDGDGWVVLDRLKHDSQTRHIPVHVISALEKQDRGLRQGAVSYLEKPVTKEALDGALGEIIEFIQRPVKNLLVVEDDHAQRQSIVELIGEGDVKVTTAGTAEEALAALGRETFDCVVVDLGLPDMSGAALIREIHKRHGDMSPPVVVYTGRHLSREEETELRMLSESIVIKDAKSPGRLLDETALFLHRVQSKLPEFKSRMLEQARKKDSVLAGRKVLVVDDDIRNIFAITAALEGHQMKVLYAESGSGALEVLQKEAGIEAVLMDVMMPEMDGFEATRRIRQLESYKKLPIICVTAKAMKGDREKCLQAGASDYVTKPVDMDQLRSLLRVWLYK